MFRRKLYLLIVLIAFSFGCEEEKAVDPNEPTFLNVTINVDEADGSTVTVEAESDHTVEYTFDAGDGSELQTNESGSFTHTYESTGIYAIEVRAYAASARYRSFESDVKIEIGDGGPTNGDDGYETPLSYDGMELVWQDEFNGDALDLTKWNYEIGDGCPNLCGWGNNELQYYREENTKVNDGKLTITAQNQNFSGRSYTSSRITTQDKYEFQYGRVDIRAKMPEGQGIWPALWMLGANINQVSWPACGEVDIMEMIGGGDGRDNVTHGTVHWDDGGYASYSGSKKLASGNLSDQYYVYTIIWTDQSIRWFINDEQFHVINIAPAGLSEFRAYFFFIMNIAVGGNWPGNPNANTQFPQEMNVDYIRVFQEN